MPTAFNPHSAIRNPKSPRGPWRLTRAGDPGPHDLPVQRGSLVGVDAVAVWVGVAGGAHLVFVEVFVAGGTDRVGVVRFGRRGGDPHRDVTRLFRAEPVRCGRGGG